MKVFIWHNVENVSTSYHDGGGVVVCAESIEAARELIKADAEKDSEPCGALTKSPDVEFMAAHDVPAGCWFFPDAGCC